MNRKRSLSIWHCVATLLLLSMLPGLLLGQRIFDPVPEQFAPRYHINFARNFFVSPEAEKADRSNLEGTLKQLESLKGNVANSADNLQHALHLYDDALVRFNRHYAYLYLRYAVNTNDEISLADSSKLEAEISTRTAFLRQEVMLIDDQTLAAFVVRKPALKSHKFAIEDVRRYRPYTLPLNEEELLNSLAPINRDWQAEFYDKLKARIPVGPANGSVSTTLEEGFKQRYAGLTADRDLYAFALIRLATARNRLAQLNHFTDAPSQVYFNSYLSQADVDDLLELIGRKADLYKRYQHLRAEHIRKITGRQEVNLWEMSIRPTGMQLPRFTIVKASQILRDALAPLGTEYGRELAALLDPANGRMDIVPGERRRRGGFSKGFIGTDSVFYSSGFQGFYNDLRILTHESTHAIHRQLMNSSHVLPVYAEGPHYLFESFAIFNEFLLPDYLYKRETDPLLKQYYLEQFLEGKGMEMFGVAPEVVLEHAVYTGVRLGNVKGADDLDALTKRIYSRYSIWPEKHDELKEQWMNISLMYEDPFYDFNYVYGVLLALKFYEIYTRDPAYFIPRYIALMRSGFDAPPASLLKRSLDIDLRDPRLVWGALKVLEGKVNLLEKSYQENPAK